MALLVPLGVLAAVVAVAMAPFGRVTTANEQRFSISRRYGRVLRTVGWDEIARIDEERTCLIPTFVAVLCNDHFVQLSNCQDILVDVCSAHGVKYNVNDP